MLFSVFSLCVKVCEVKKIYEHICLHLLFSGIVTSYHLRVVKVGKEGCQNMQDGVFFFLEEAEDNEGVKSLLREGFCLVRGLEMFS